MSSCGADMAQQGLNSRRQWRKRGGDGALYILMLALTRAGAMLSLHGGGAIDVAN